MRSKKTLEIVNKVIKDMKKKGIAQDVIDSYVCEIGHSNDMAHVYRIIHSYRTKYGLDTTDSLEQHDDAPVCVGGDNTQTFTRQQVEEMMNKAVNWMDANFDSYIGRSDYLPSEFKEFMQSLLDNQTI